MNTFGADTEDDATDWGQENVEGKARRKLSCDPKCDELARHCADHYGEAEVRDLAQSIQDAVEAWFEDHNEPNRSP